MLIEAREEEGRWWRGAIVAKRNGKRTETTGRQKMVEGCNGKEVSVIPDLTISYLKETN
jgi:hypothetical protein